MEEYFVKMLPKNVYWIVSNSPLKLIPTNFSPEQIAISPFHESNGLLIYSAKGPSLSPGILSLLLPKCSYIYTDMKRNHFFELVLTTEFRHLTFTNASKFFRAVTTETEGIPFKNKRYVPIVRTTSLDIG